MQCKLYSYFELAILTVRIKHDVFSVETIIASLRFIDRRKIYSLDNSFYVKIDNKMVGMHLYVYISDPMSVQIFKGLKMDFIKLIIKCKNVFYANLFDI